MSFKLNLPPAYDAITVKSSYARNASESAHPQLWDGLLGAWVPDLSNQTIRDLTERGTHGELVLLSADEAGVFYEEPSFQSVGNESGTYGEYGKVDISNLVSSSDSKPITVTARVRSYSSGGSKGGRIFSLWNSSDSNKFLTVSDPNTFAWWIVNENVGGEWVTTQPNTVNVWNTFTLHFGNDYRRLLVNGIERLNSTSTGQDPGVVDTLLMGTLQLSSFSNKGSFYHSIYLLHDRELTDEEQILLHRDPYAPFRKKRTLFFSGAVEPGSAEPVAYPVMRLPNRTTTKLGQEIDYSNPLNQGLVAYFPFSQKGGNALRNEATRTYGEANEATLNSIAQSQWVGGPTPYAKAIDLIGSPDRADATHYNGLGFGDSVNDSPFSIACWVYIDALTNGGLVSKSSFGSRFSLDYGLFLSPETGNRIRFACFDNESGKLRGIDSSAIPSTKKWIHVTATYNGNKATSGFNMYWDGIDIATNAVSFGSYTAMHTNTGAKLYLGVWLPGFLDQYLNGKLSDARIYDRELTPGEVGGLYDMVRTGGQFRKRSTIVTSFAEPATVDPVAYPIIRVPSKVRDTNPEVNWNDPLNKGLVAWWPFRQKGGDTLRDIVGQRNATQSGTLGADDWGVYSPSHSGNTYHGPKNSTAVWHETTGDSVTGAAGSMACWAKQSPAQAGEFDQLVWTAWTSSSDRIILNFESYGTDTIAAGFGTNTNNNYAFGTVWTVGQWHHLVVTWENGSPMRLFIDGVHDADSVNNYTTQGPFTDLFIGNYDTATLAAGFVGEISDFRSYNRPLPDSEVWSLYQASRQGYPDQFRTRSNIVLSSADPAPPPTGGYRTYENYYRQLLSNTGYS